MSEYIGQYRFRNENKCIKEKVMIALIIEKMVESCLRWVDHVWRRPTETLVREVGQMENSPIARDSTRPRKTIAGTIKKNKSILIVWRLTWFTIIHVADHT